jgi:hypothetical protein
MYPDKRFRYILSNNEDAEAFPPTNVLLSVILDVVVVALKDLATPAHPLATGIETL